MPNIVETVSKHKAWHLWYIRAPVFVCMLSELSDLKEIALNGYDLIT